jgi:hypothetical protein
VRLLQCLHRDPVQVAVDEGRSETGSVWRHLGRRRAHRGELSRPVLQNAYVFTAFPKPVVLSIPHCERDLLFTVRYRENVTAAGRSENISIWEQGTLTTPASRRSGRVHVGI